MCSVGVDVPDDEPFRCGKGLKRSLMGRKSIILYAYGTRYTNRKADDLVH